MPSQAGEELCASTSLGCCQPLCSASGVRQQVKSFKWGEGCTENVFSGSKTPVPLGLPVSMPCPQYSSFPGQSDLPSPGTQDRAHWGSVDTSHGRRELPRLEELWPPPPRLPGHSSSLKDVGNEVQAAGSTDEVAFLSVLSSDKRPGAAHAFQPSRLIRLFMASRAEPRGRQAGGRAAGSGVPGGYIQALVLTASGSCREAGEKGFN